MMESLKNLIERWGPDLVIGSAAIGVFILLGVVVFLSIIFENWFDAMKHQPKPVDLESVALNPASRKLRSNLPPARRPRFGAALLNPTVPPTSLAAE